MSPPSTSLSPTDMAFNGYILWEVAKARLQDAGYQVEYMRGIMYARSKPHSMPDRMYSKNGRISEKTVKTLERKARERG